MKKIILGIVGLITVSSLTAQVTIQIDGTGADVAGTTVTVNCDPSTIFPIEKNFIVTNNTGSDQQWRITRVKQSVPAGWTDQLCWPPNCYPTSGDVYITPNSGGNPAPTVLNGTHMTANSEEADIHPKVTPDQSSASTGLYMYYITDLSGNYIDSVALEINFTLGVEEDEIEPLTVEVAPNPATEYVTIQTKGTSKTSVKMVDVLGNIVYKETLTSSSKKIDVSTFRNGVYFVIVESEDNQVINRKVIVRH